MVFRERAVAEHLVDFCRRASGDGLSIGSFRADVRLCRLDRLDFWLFLSRPQHTFAARNIPRIGAFAFTREAIARGAVGAWVAGRRLRGIGGGGHCWSKSSRRGA